MFANESENSTLISTSSSSISKDDCFNQLQSLYLNSNVTGDKSLMQEKVVYAESFFGLYCIATTFLLVTVIVYAATWRKQKLNGWVIFAFSMSTCSSYLFWTFSLGKWLFQTDRPCGDRIRPVLIGTSFCNVVGIIILFSDFAAFTWMTILNYSICTTIRSMKPRASDSTNRKQFWVYNAIGFGVPTVITTVSVIKEHLLGYFDDQIVRLQYGYDPCGVDKYYITYMVKCVYAAVLLLKLVFAYLVIRSLWDYKRGTKLLQQQKRPNPMKEAVMYTKLLVLMDFTWIFEIIWGVSADSETTNTYTWYRVLQDVIYILQALCLFWVFVCKKEIKDLLSQQYPFCKCVLKSLEDRFAWIRCKAPRFFNAAPSQGQSLSTASSSPAAIVMSNISAQPNTTS